MNDPPAPSVPAGAIGLPRAGGLPSVGAAGALGVPAAGGIVTAGVLPVPGRSTTSGASVGGAPAGGAPAGGAPGAPVGGGGSSGIPWGQTKETFTAS